MANVKATDLIDFTRASTGTYLDSDGTLKTAANNIPRIEYDADGNLLGLLIEEARTNQFIQSENFTLGAWGRARAVPVRDAVGPTGVANSAVTMSDNASGNSSTVYIQETVTGLTTGNDYTASVFGKKGTLDVLALKASSLGLTGGTAFFDLANGTLGTVGSGLTATVKDYGNGWYRCSITFTATADTSGTIRIQMWEQIDGGNFLHDGTKNILIFGAQFEEGSFPTSYIKTTGSTASRSADVASIDVDQFGYNQSEGTVTVEATMLSSSVSTSSASQAYFGFFKTDQLNRLEAYSDSSSTITVRDRVAGTNNDATLSSVTLTDTNKLAVAFESGAKTAAVLNGGSVSETSSTTNNAAYETLILGDTQNVDAELNGHIKSLTYTPKRLSNAKLQELTS